MYNLYVQTVFADMATVNIGLYAIFEGYMSYYTTYPSLYHDIQTAQNNERNRDLSA